MSLNHVLPLLALAEPHLGSLREFPPLLVVPLQGEVVLLRVLGGEGAGEDGHPAAAAAPGHLLPRLAIDRRLNAYCT